MTISERIDTFLAADAFGVVGASAKPHKYGNKVLRCYLQNQHEAIATNRFTAYSNGFSARPLRCALTGRDLPSN